MSNMHYKKSDAHDAYHDKVINWILKFQFYNYLDDSELASKTWLSISTIQKIKHKKHFPTMTTLKKLKRVWIQLPRSFIWALLESPIISKPP